MEKIEHKALAVNGINLHVAEIGEGPAILLLHGFPELWYSWRHQMLFLSSRGYRAIAPDLRGFGDSDAPPSAAAYTALHVVGDLVALLDSLGLDRVFLVGHDWGAAIAWFFCLFRPDRIKALVNTSIVFKPRNPSVKPIQARRDMFGDDYYMCRFQEVGKIDDEFASVDTAKLMKTILSLRDPSPPCFPKDKAFGAFLDIPFESPLPPWLTQEDIDYFATKYRKTGITGGLNYYRCMDVNWELTAPWTGVQIRVPVKFIVGDLDMTYNIPGAKDYIHNGGFKKNVPLLEEVVVMEGVAHFINQEKPEDTSAHIYDFIEKFKN
ncbi:Soluble epoxide hydrolase [Bertholletia excelsa]